MTPRTLIVLAIAVFSGIAAAVGVVQLRRPAVAGPIKPEVELLPVAGVELLRGDLIKADSISEVEWPKSLVPPGALKTKEELLGKFAQQRMVAGEIFLSGKIGETAKFSVKIEDGLRGTTIMTPDDASFVAGMIEPGDIVDVIYTNDQTEDEYSGGATSAPLLQGVEVVAIGNVIEPDKSRNETRQMRSVTLAVPLGESTMLSLAAKTGILQLVLRNDHDVKTDDVGGFSLNELREISMPVSLRTQQKVAPEITQDPEPDPAIMNRIAELEQALKDQVGALAGQLSAQQAAAEAAKIPLDTAPSPPPAVTVRTIRGFVPGSVVLRLPTKTSGALFSDTVKDSDTANK